jgi:hypothetical protein
MNDPSEYQKRAEKCVERARSVPREDDRVRWLQLAEQWMALSRMPFQRLPAQRAESIARGVQQR